LRSAGSRTFTPQPGFSKYNKVNVDTVQGDAEPWDSEAGRAAMSPLGATETEDLTLSETPTASVQAQLMKKQNTWQDDEDFSKKGEDISAFYGAMGWRKQIENVFAAREGADCLTRFVYGPFWALLSVVMIVINTAFIGIEIHFSTNHHLQSALNREGNWPSVGAWDGSVFNVIERVFLGWFLLEVLVNLYAQKKEFFVGSDWHWNLFDVLVVTTALIMQIYEFASIAFLRVVRLLRLGKMLRAFRVFKFLRGIRSMLISIAGSLVHLFSAMLLMCIFIYTVSLVIMQSIASETKPGRLLEGVGATNPRDLTTFSSFENGDTHVQKVYMLYGGIGRTMMTLFMTISGGLEWRSAAEPMVQLGWFYAALWTCYICFMIFGMLNVLTGIFVDAAFQAMMSDRDNIIQTQLEEKKSMINLIRGVFEQSDSDNSGQVSMEEFQLLMKNHEMAAYLSAIGIDSSEAQGLFRLLDDDGSGSVSIDEFVTGFLRLKGSAKSVDMVMLLYENRKISKKLNRIFKEARSVNNNFNSMMAVNSE